MVKDLPLIDEDRFHKRAAICYYSFSNMPLLSLFKDANAFIVITKSMIFASFKSLIRTKQLFLHSYSSKTPILLAFINISEASAQLSLGSLNSMVSQIQRKNLFMSAS